MAEATSTEFSHIMQQFLNFKTILQQRSKKQVPAIKACVKYASIIESIIGQSIILA